MHRDAFVVWRYLLDGKCLASVLVRRLARDKDFDVVRGERAINRAIGAGWVFTEAVTRVDPRDGQTFSDRMLTARPDERKETA